MSILPSRAEIDPNGHAAEGWTVNPEGRRITQHCRRCAETVIRAYEMLGQAWTFEPFRVVPVPEAVAQAAETIDQRPRYVNPLVPLAEIEARIAKLEELERELLSSLKQQRDALADALEVALVLAESVAMAQPGTPVNAFPGVWNTLESIKSALRAAGRLMPSWDSSAAKIYLQDVASGFRSEASYIEDSIGQDGVHVSKEEFTLFLEHGLGYSEKEIMTAVEGILTRTPK